MRKQIALTLCTILAMNAGAERISRDEAMALAQDFMQGKIMVPAQTSSSKAPVRGGANDESYYIFNAADNGGYAIIAADDRISPVLGFSDQGNIDLDNMPENMASWLEYYKNEINILKYDADIVLDTPVYRNEVKPMLNNYWNNYSPYNLLCPVYDGARSLVGSYAITMAQIMFYHKWPVGVVDSIPPYANLWHDNELVEGLPATTFKWDLIKPSYLSYETDESAYAVAELLRYCGQAIKTSYHPYASGSNSGNVLKALIERFNYSRQAEMIHKWQYSSYDWNEIIYNELASGRPVYYSGYRTSDDELAFVCDGYKDGYFHINWGQGSYCDGYYKLSLLTKEGTDIYDQNNYGYLQQAIIGIEPEMNSLIGVTLMDGYFKYTILSDTSAMIQAIDGKDYYGIDTLWIPGHVDYNGNRYYVTRLGTSSNWNYNIKKVYLPSTLKQIDDKASFLQTIKEFTLTSNIEMFSSTAFGYSYTFEKFINEDNSRYKVIDGVLFSHDGKEILCYPQYKKGSSYTVPDGVEIIGSCAFYDSYYLYEIKLPDCVEHINDCAFQYCTRLKKINLPENLKDIGIEAFVGCYNLNDVTLPQNIGTISIQAFNWCESLKSIIIPNSPNFCLSIETFLNCSSLESVYIPSGVTYIRINCFKGCSALKEIFVESVIPPVIESVSVFDESVYENAVLKVPADKVELFRNSEIWSRFKNISAIPSYAINGINYILNESAKTAVVCPGQELYSGDIVIPATVEYNGIEYSVNALQPAAFANCKNLTSVVIDAPVPVLPDSLFKKCSSLKSVTFNDRIEKIGYEVFLGCSALEAIDIPQSVTSIDKAVFVGCRSLRTITIPESVRSLGAFAFWGCSNLDSVTILGNIKKIDTQTFYNCTNLTYVSLPQSIAMIAQMSFEKCSNLQTIKIPENVKLIGTNLFLNCTSLTSIVLPESVIIIEDYAFNDCQNLTSFYCCAENPQEISIGKDVFNSINDKCILYVPKGSVQAYRNDNRWSAFSEIREFDVTQVEYVSDKTADTDAVPVEWYNLSGSKLPAQQQGINIIRYSDGTVRKVTQ